VTLRVQVAAMRRTLESLEGMAPARETISVIPHGEPIHSASCGAQEWGRYQEETESAFKRRVLDDRCAEEGTHFVFFSS
jgi:hypothetical protein